MSSKFPFKHCIPILALFFLTACSGGTVVPAAAPGETATPAPAKPTAQVDVIETPSSTPIPEPTATTDPLNGLDPEIRKFFVAQSIPFEVGTDGSLRVDLADTTDKESVTIENITHTKTNDGLSQNIITATNKEDGSRMVHVEGFGWVKDMEFNFEDPNTLTVVPENWSNRVINTLAALHYDENPRIPKDAVNPHFYINTGGYGGNMGHLSLDKEPGGTEDEAQFTKDTKPFVWSGFIKRGDQVIFVETSKNPTTENKDQLINLLYGLDLNVYEELRDEILGDGKTSSLEDIILNFHNQLVAGILPPQEKDGVTFGFNAETFVHYNGMTPNVGIARLQKPGELLDLFDPEDQENILNVFKVNQAYFNGQGTDFINQVRVSSLPSKLSDFVLLTSIDDWGDAFIGKKY